MGPIVKTTTRTFGTNTVMTGAFDATDNSPLLDKFVITFDRPVAVSTVSAADLHVYFRAPGVSTLTDPYGTLVPVLSVTPLDTTAAGYGTRRVGGTTATPANQLATTFLVTLTTPQRKVGTYSYVVTPNIRDEIRKVTPVFTGPTTTTTGNSTAPTTITDPATVSSAPVTVSSPILIANTGGLAVTDVQVTVNITHARPTTSSSRSLLPMALPRSFSPTGPATIPGQTTI